MQVRGVDFIWAMSSDMERSVAFYRDFLGLPAAGIQSSSWKEFRAGNVTLAVTPLHVGRRAPEFLAAFAVDDVNAAVEEARQSGIPILHETRDTPACWNAMIADPDGNPVWLHRRKDGSAG
jgi:predicted enzyme related to lactoylglutathione lyase